MRILHLTTVVRGGSGQALVQLATAQRAEGHLPVVVTDRARFGPENDPVHVSALALSGITVHAVDSSCSREKRGPRRFATWIRPRLGAVTPFDVIHLHAERASATAYALVAERPLDAVPIVHTLHDARARPAASDPRSELDALRRADRVVVASEHAKRALTTRGLPAHLVSVIAYGVEPLVLRPRGDDPLLAEMRAWRQRGGEVLCMASAVSHAETERTLVDALATLVNRESLLSVCVGGGDTTRLEAQAHRFGLAARLRVSRDGSAARAVVAAADYLLLRSPSDGPPLWLLEAWADLVPVLCSRTPELLELSADGQAAVLFDPNDVADVARAVTTLRRATPASRRMLMERGRERYRERFTLRAMVDGYLGEYARLLAAKRAVA